MNRDDILKILKEYDFDYKEYVVISGAAMVLHGIKLKTNDIDISVSDKYNDYLLKKYNCVYERTNEYNKNAYMINNIIDFSISFMPEDIKYIDNIPVSSVEDIIKLKRFINREKDKKDIKLINDYINNVD